MHSADAVARPAILLLLLASGEWAQAQLGDFEEYQWIGGSGAQNWQDDANWDLAGFPNDDDPEDMVFPTANLSVNLASDLNVNVGTTPVTVAGLTLGGTSGAVTTEISSGSASGQLRFRNDLEVGLEETNDADFTNDGVVSGGDFMIWQRNNGFINTGPDNINDQGDANRDDLVDPADLAIWHAQFGFGAGRFSEGSAFIFSTGVAGSVARITAPIHLDNEPVQISAPTPLTIDAAATITFNGAADLSSNASLSVVNGLVTVNSEVVVLNVNTAPNSGGTDLGLNSSGRTAGTLILRGVVRDANPLEPGAVRFGGGDGRIEIYGDNELTGTVRTGGDVILLGHDHALGVSPTDPSVVATVRPGGTFYSDDDDRTIPNKMILQSTFNVAGDKSLTLSGEITQTNNRGFDNNIAGPGRLILSGLLNIWEDDEALVREFDFRGTGTTVITGQIRDDPLNSGNDRRINQVGPGVLIIDVDSGDNQHSGPTTITRGNFHYANNDSLNAGAGMILSRGGAIGVDTGIATNTSFAAKIDPASTGGIMLAPSDAAANLDFTTTLANAAGMTVAAPETGLTYTGTITPANSTYGLGGGAGTLTLPDAQLTGANSLEVRNEGVVELLGDNTYTGTTTILRRPSSSDPLTLAVDQLADGSVPSSIGASTADASNLTIQGGTLKYVGDGDSTDRLFTIGTAGATIDSSGAGPVVFSNAGDLGRADAADRAGDLDDFTGRPDQITNIADTSDIVVGMSVNDPDPGGITFGRCATPSGENCIPIEDPDNPGEPVRVTGVSSDGSTIGISANVPFVQKLNTRIVFGTVERTLTLTGTNADDNTLAAAIGDSDAGGVVSVEKTGSGKWVLAGNNTYTGDTFIDDGVLSVVSPFFDPNSSIELTSGGMLDLNYGGENVVAGLVFDGIEQADGRWGGIGNVLADFTSSFLSGTGLLNVGNVPAAAASAAVPEPSLAALVAGAFLGIVNCRRR